MKNWHIVDRRSSSGAPDGEYGIVRGSGRLADDDRPDGGRDPACL
jgi:hypothetical protein